MCPRLTEIRSATSEIRRRKQERRKTTAVKYNCGEGFVLQVGFKPGVREGVIDEQNGESKYEAMMGDGIGESDTEKLDWHQNEIDEEIKGVEVREGSLL